MSQLDCQVQRRGGRLLLGLSTGTAILDVVSTPSRLRACRAAMRSRTLAFRGMRMGSFGPYHVTLNLNVTGPDSLFVDGPAFDQDRTQSAAIFFDRRELVRILDAVLATPGTSRRRPAARRIPAD